MEYYWTIKNTKVLIHAATLNLKDMLSERSKTQKNDILHNSIHMKYQKTNVQRQKVNDDG